jgi:glycerol-3-phosphate O-acyltransferase
VTTIDTFDRDRAAIAATVRERVCRAYVSRAAEGGRPIAAVLRAVAAAMTSGAGERPEHDRRADFDWVGIADDLEHADANDLERRLAAVVTFFLDDIGGGFDPATYRAVSGVLPAVLRVMLGRPLSRDPLAARLTVDGPIERIRALAAAGTLVLAPTHSSNLDAIVLGLAMARHGLPPCTYATAKHMYRNRLVGALVRRLGGYRVDRGLRLDLYADVLAELSTVLLERGLHALIFPGATRCRTNEVEPALKLGLLATAARARRNRPDRPIWIVPVTINHEVVLEAEWLIEYHLAGRGEERIVGDELLVWDRLATSARRLWELESHVAIRFVEPIEPAPSRVLAGVLTAAYRRATVLFATHVAARAMFDLAVRAGTADVHALRRTPFACEAGALYAEVARVVALVRATPAGGALAAAVPDDPAAIVEAARRAWASCHRAEPIRRTGAQLAIGDAGLVYFYRNRTSHIV